MTIEVLAQDKQRGRMRKRLLQDVKFCLYVLYLERLIVEEVKASMSSWRLVTRTAKNLGLILDQGLSAEMLCKAQYDFFVCIVFVDQSLDSEQMSMKTHGRNSNLQIIKLLFGQIFYNKKKNSERNLFILEENEQTKNTTKKRRQRPRDPEGKKPAGARRTKRKKRPNQTPKHLQSTETIQKNASNWR